MQEKILKERYTFTQYGPSLYQNVFFRWKVSRWERDRISSTPFLEETILNRASSRWSKKFHCYKDENLTILFLRTSDTKTPNMSNACSRFQRKRTLNSTLKSPQLPICRCPPRFLLRTQFRIDCKDWIHGWTWPLVIGLKPKATFSASAARKWTAIMDNYDGWEGSADLREDWRLEDSRRCTE